MKRELERTRAELCKYKPGGAVEELAIEEKLKKELAQQEELNNSLEGQIKVSSLSPFSFRTTAS
jgi:hypothetical protein